jgi:putative transposase
MDFLSDALSDGRRFRVLTVVDTFTREGLAARADFRFTGDQVVAAPEGLTAERGAPASIGWTTARGSPAGRWTCGPTSTA